MTQHFESFDEFWPYYVEQHKKKLTRQIHFIGTSLAVACLAGGLIGRPRWLVLLAPFAGYAPAWISHLLVERNRPATFSHPIWSLQADLVMWGKTLAGTMDEEVERILGASPPNGSAGEARPNMSPDRSVN
jgi:hypothetical protein